MQKIIYFKSTEENYRKEESGIKSNIVRFIDDWMPHRWIRYINSTHVRIHLKGHPKTSFLRIIKDKTRYKNVVIISW